VNPLELVGVRKAFDRRPVLSGIDLGVPAGSFTALLGPSGSGKTTLLRILAGFERADAGRVLVDDVVVDDGDRVLAPERRRLGYVPQEGALFPHMTVEKNVAFGLGSRSVRRAARNRVAELLEMVGLAGLGDRYPHQLSGGQQQRVALARALAVSPRAILLDEPFSSLDAEMRASVRADVLAVLRAAGTTTLFVTHDQDEALSSADQVAVLVGGRVAQLAAPRELYTHPASPAIALFLGANNLLEGTVEGGGVRTALGLHQVEAGAGLERGRVVVLLRPEQLYVSDDEATGHAGEVLAAEFLGHDVVVRVRPDGCPTLVARVDGHRLLRPGARVGIGARGPVVAWPPGTDPTPAASENTSM
jgi:iron(III) transport system ATP-binding protein